MPSKRSRSRTSRTCSSVPISVPELLSTGVPRVAASYEIGVPSVMPATVSARCERGAEAAQLGGRAAERELVLLGRGEVPVQRVAGIDAHPAVQVDGGVRDPVAAVGGPELGRGDLLVARQPCLEPPGCLP